MKSSPKRSVFILQQEIIRDRRWEVAPSPVMRKEEKSSLNVAVASSLGPEEEYCGDGTQALVEG